MSLFLMGFFVYLLLFVFVVFLSCLFLFYYMQTQHYNGTNTTLRRHMFCSVSEIESKIPNFTYMLT